MDTQTLKNRIAALQRLADPKRSSTPEHERAVAKEMLKHHLKLLSDQPAQRSWEERRWYGERYTETRGMSLTEIAKLIRAEVKLTRKMAKLPAAAGAIALADPIADAPAEVKIGIRTEYYSGGGSINITLKSVPVEWGWELGRDRWGHECQMPTPALEAFAKALKAIMNSYNYDGSDAMVDYYDVRFYGHVSADSGRILA